MKRILLMIAMVSLVGCGKKGPVQPSASNTEGTKPEPIKAKAIAGVKLWEFETGSYVNRNDGEVFGVQVAKDRHKTGQTFAFGGGDTYRFHECRPWWEVV